MRTSLVLPGFFLFVFSGWLQAGWIIQGRQQEGQEPPLTQTTYLDAAGVCVETADGTTIFQAKEKRFIMADPEDKTYQVMDAQAMKRLMGGVTAAMKQVQDSLAGMNAEQKAMVEKLMGGQTIPGQAPSAPPTPPVTTYKKIAGGVTVAAWTTDHYEVFENGTKESEIWVAPPGALAIEKDLLKLFAEMGAFFKDLLAAMPMGMATQTAKTGFEMELPGANAPVGIPVKEVVFRNGAPASTWEITQATRSDIPAGKFEAPPGYQQKSFLDAGN